MHTDKQTQTPTQTDRQTRTHTHTHTHTHTQSRYCSSFYLQELLFCIKNFLLADGETPAGHSTVKYPALSVLGISSALVTSTLLLLMSSVLLLMSILLLTLLGKPVVTLALFKLLVDDIYRLGERALNESDSSRLYS